ncbi:GNAT family N-acetyltransferase [Clostridium estertheticum]|uniref:GNAT family N-acetyltransferase n=1 Tax=Clostridium estertheticum TaxID=238834 RepID=UPI0013E92EB7|nr:GNAT family N-acetyltransferase [Clostridium estertheticum]MBZ9687818.1 GNAT family N-acetyltransferase [Clostridium estertheticum]
MVNEIKLAERCNTIAIVDLLNTVTLNLHRKNINQWIYPWDFKEIEIDIKNRSTYMITIDNLIVGTFSIKDVGVNTWNPSIKSNNLYLYRIAILPEYQGKNIGLQIINYACKISIDSKKTLYLDCWAGNEKLKDFYFKVGFDFCGEFPEEDYRISVFKYK